MTRAPVGLFFSRPRARETTPSTAQDNYPDLLAGRDIKGHF